MTKFIKRACATVTFCTTAVWAQRVGPIDPQIAAIMVTANQVDIDAGKLAERRSHSKEVRNVAQLMITDHSGVNKSVTELVTKLHVTSESNATRESLKQGDDQNLANPRRLSGYMFAHHMSHISVTRVWGRWA